MYKTLCKSRLQAMFAGLVFSSKKGRRRSGGAIFGMGLLMLYGIGCFFFLMYLMADQLCGPLMASGLHWLYFSLMGLTSIALGVIGSVFAAHSQLYEAKDNELLLSMPIPPSAILGSRMLLLYLQNLLLSLIVLLPTLGVYLGHTAMTPLAIICFVLICLLLPLLSLAISCVLALLVALVTSRLRSKTFFTMALSLGFLVVYFYGYTKVNAYLQLLITNSAQIGETIKSVVFPIYHMGLAALGEPLSMLWFGLCCIVPFAVICWLLARSFVRIATTKRGANKVRYRERAMQVRSVDRALLSKELRHFAGSPMYMLNGAMGSLFLLVGAVAAAMKWSDVITFLGLIPGISAWMVPIGIATICVLAATNIIAAPSVSLEGKAIWQMQAMPVSAWKVLMSKLKLHLLVTAIPCALCSVTLVVLLRPTPLMIVFLLLIPFLFALLTGLFGLMINLLLPRLDWVSEAHAVKQSASTMLSMLGNWIFLALVILLCVVLRTTLSIPLLLALFTLVLALACVLVGRWLHRRGTVIFGQLH